jgi:coproporphyrinogen III oxidase
MKNKFVIFIEDLQNNITEKLEQEDGGAIFKEDTWERPGGGGGKTRIIENGAVFEKGGVNTSRVFGKLPISMQEQLRTKYSDFFASGISLVLHPKNPMASTVHANFRYFELYNKNKNIVDHWFGGGLDLTPYYLFEEDVTHFHKVCKEICDKHDPDFYENFKLKCDNYFWNHHRDEARGVGGLFFDYCRPNEKHNLNSWFNFVTEIGSAFLDAYLPIVRKRKNLNFTPENRDWQELRRGRYVEFNLVHDKGTLFGLKTKGRIESVLMSLPPVVKWGYDKNPKKGSEEEKLISILKNPKSWV